MRSLINQSIIKMSYTMKKNIYLTAVVLTAIGLVLSCAKETPAPEEQPIDSQVEVTTNPSIIKAGIPDAITKVALSDNGVGSGMSLAWEAGDELRVIATAGGSGNEAFSIKEGFTATSAEFEGEPVAGSAFTVFYPGTYDDEAAINARSYTSQVQIGNANTDHLEWNAIESGVADYGTVSFSNKQNGALRFHLQLPAAFTKVYKVALKTPSAIFSTTNAGDDTTDELILTLKTDDSTPGITLGGDKVLTAYLMVSWNDNFIAEGTDLNIEVWGDQEDPWVKTKTVGAGGFHIAGGKVTNVQLNNSNWDEPLFWAGDGSQANPYVIKTAYHLRNVKTVMRANPTTGLYFQLANDIDLEDAVWEQVNLEHTPYTIHFDGGNHTISNFSIPSNEMGLCSFFGEIRGEVKDLAFSTATIVAGGTNGSSGVLCGIANGLTVNNVDATNVDITIVRSPGETTGVGGLIGYAIGSTISNCDLTGCDITIGKRDDDPTKDAEPQNVGGLIGRLRESASSVTNCSVSSATLSAKYCAGGLIGKVACTSGPVEIKDNTVSGMTVSFLDAESSSQHGAGGLIGLIQAGNAVTVNVGAASHGNTVTNLIINQSLGYVGGLVGHLKAGDIAIADAAVGGTITSAAQCVGGLVGRTSVDGTSYDNCSFNGSVTGTYLVGGLIGGDSADREYTLNNCNSQGSVTATSSHDYSGDASFVGGLIGIARNNTKTDAIVLTNCWSSANVTGNKGTVGGLIGEAVGVTLGEKDGDVITAAKACEYKDGTLTGPGNDANNNTCGVGGLIGITRGSYGTKVYGGKVTDATISGKQYVGGIIGHNNCSSTQIEGCNVTSTSPSARTSVTGSRYYVGGILGGAGVNVSISRCNVDADISGVSIVGGIFSYDWHSVLNISHCNVAGSVEATGTAGSDSQTWSHVGGIAAFAYQKTSRIEYCDVTANITGQIAAGGIVGRNRGGIFDHCSYRNGTITAGSYVGGMSGAATADDGAQFTDCTVSGATISASGSDGRVGGIVGNTAVSLTAERCTVGGTLSASSGSHVGGIVGRTDDISAKTITISACTSTANLSGNQNVGGIIGRGYATLSISSCKSSGNIFSTKSSDNSYVAGIAANVCSGTIEKCSSTAVLKGKNIVGGVVGSVYWGNLSVSECAFEGEIIESINNVGGLVGWVYQDRTLTLNNSYSAGAGITASGEYVGGAVGKVGNANANPATLNMQNCYVKSAITATGASVVAQGGLIGGANNNSTTYSVSNCLVWSDGISIATSQATDGVVVGRVHSSVGTAANSITDCWFAYDLSYTATNGHTPAAGGSDLTSIVGSVRYDGKQADSGTTCQAKASALSWSTTIWKLDNGNGFPTLKNLPE